MSSSSNDPSACQLRRATLDDLKKLRSLWERDGLSVSELERRLTEFQVACAPNGDLLASAGLHMANRQGHIHNAVFRSSELQSELLPLFWQRLMTLAQNHGLLGLWIVQGNPFETSAEFASPDSEELKRRLPASFGDRDQRWLVLNLREEVPPAVLLEKEFELFKQDQLDLSDRSMRQARVLRSFAILLGFAFLALVLWMLWQVLRRFPIRSQPERK